MMPIRVGIAGLGSIGRRHLDTLRALPGVRVVAAADPNPPAGYEAGNVAILSSYEEMLDTVALDAVLLCTPSFLHCRQGVQAAQRGLHVIAEKPMATTLKGADDVIAACAEHGVQLAVIHQYRYHEPMIALRRLVRDGTLGDLVLLTVAVNWRRDPEYYQGTGAWRGTWKGDGGGALMNQGIHAVDLALWLGGPAGRVTALTTNVRHPIEAEDTISAAIAFERGGLGALQVTTCAARNQPLTLRYEGTKGSAVVVGQTLTVDDEVVLAGPASVDRTGAHRAQFVEIFRALAAAGTPSVSGADARATLEATFAIYEAARTRAPVTVS